ncbi:MAG: Asp-tRNA(Asn)/Glu-tRNA(Gln) amidotransferase subunit GatA [Planctomycetota bacterium]
MGAGEVSALEVTEAALARLAATEPSIGAYLFVDEDAARAAAAAVDAKRARGEDPGVLAGVPVGIKDNLATPFAPTTAGSRILEGYRPPYQASAVTRLLAAGAVCLGKTNLDEFAMGSSTERSAYHNTKNPWDPSRVPGGSSGGSAAAVAAGSATLALGSDTGGSIRQPAALCGVVGLKPTYGIVSRYGLLAFASSLDQVGPIGRTVEDCALALDAIAGPDSLDATSIREEPAAFASGLDRFPEGLRVGIPTEHLELCASGEVREAVERAAEALSGLGAKVREVALPMTAHGIATYYIVATAEASSNLSRYDGVHYGHRTEAPETMHALYARSRGEGFGAEVKRRIMLGTFVLSSGYKDAYYLRAQKARTLIARDFDRVFDSCDVILGPTTPTPAFPIGERTEDPLAMYAADVFTVLTNLAGLPGISLPGGLSQGGLPLGVQLMAQRGDDGRLLCVAHALEGALGSIGLPRIEGAGGGL